MAVNIFIDPAFPHIGVQDHFHHRINSFYYKIPYRSLLPRETTNLAVAGRCISADHVAYSSTRIQGTCMLTGQAAGVAAAIAAREGKALRQLTASKIQEALIRQGVFLSI